MNHRIYSSKLVDDLKNHLEKGAFKYVTYPQFIFLCGKGFDTSNPSSFANTNRGITQNYINKLASDVYVVLSEELWLDEYCSDIDLLTFEEFLAEVSNYIILFVESPGTFCELGAFVYADKLFSDKLLIVMDEKYKNSQSFIQKGPISKAIQLGSAVIYAPIENGALLSGAELRSKVLEIVGSLNRRSSRTNCKYISSDPSKIKISSFVAEIIELLKMVQPIEQRELIQLYKEIKGFESFSFVKSDDTEFQREIKVGYIFHLLAQIRLISNDTMGITLLDHKKVQPLMFKYQGMAQDRIRNRLLCRKYRYGGKN